MEYIIGILILASFFGLAVYAARGGNLMMGMLIMAIFKADAILRPDYYLCVGARVMDFNGTGELEQILMLMDVEMQMVDPSEDIVIVGAKNQL